MTVRGRTDRFRLSDLAARDQVEVVADFHCVTTWSVRELRWQGVRLRDVLRDVNGDVLDDERPPFARVIGADGAAARFVIDDILGVDVLLATHLDGEPLSLRHGAPIRLVAPGHYGYKHLKHVVRIEFSNDLPRGRHGAKEHLRGRVDHEERHQRLPSWLVRPVYRLVIVPTAVLAERSLRRAENASAERPS